MDASANTANTAAHSGFETQGETSPVVQNRGISRLTNGTYVSRDEDERHGV